LASIVNCIFVHVVAVGTKVVVRTGVIEDSAIFVTVAVVDILTLNHNAHSLRRYKSKRDAVDGIAGECDFIYCLWEAK